MFRITKTGKDEYYVVTPTGFMNSFTIKKGTATGGLKVKSKIGKPF